MKTEFQVVLAKEYYNMNSLNLSLDCGLKYSTEVITKPKPEFKIVRELRRNRLRIIFTGYSMTVGNIKLL